VRVLCLTLALCVLSVAMRARHLERLCDRPAPFTEVERAAWALAWDGELRDALGPNLGKTAHVAPLYPCLLAGAYRLHGRDHFADAQRTQAFLAIGLITAALLLLPAIAGRASLRPAAGWAAAFALAARPSGWLEVPGDQELPIATLLLAALIWAFLGLRQSGWARRPALLAGLLTGATALGSPGMLPAAALMILAGVALDAGRRWAALRSGLVVAGVAGAVVAPWAVRNAVAVGAFVPLRSNFGLELAIGNYAGADGTTYNTFSPGLERFAARHPFASDAERERLRSLGEPAYMAARQREALAWARERPGDFVALCARRAWLFWGLPAKLWSPAAVRPSNTALLEMAVRAAALLGLARLVARRRTEGAVLAAGLLGASLVYLVTHVDLRYRFPVQGLLCLLACDLVLAAGLAAVRAVTSAPAPATP
jgi:hypothetical protein